MAKSPASRPAPATASAKSGLQGKAALFTLGVAYYPDYLTPGQLARLPSGDIKALSVEDRLAVDFARMQADGITAVRIGEFSWGHVEPAPGILNTAVFAKSLDLALKHNITVILCTPTATPPKWLVAQHPEILPITRSGATIPWGGRRHYDPVSPVYRAESRRITEVYAKAFGSHPAVIAWQTDNELANHKSSECFTTAVRDAFRVWLVERYAGDIAKLNEYWFTNFWSHYYRSFGEVELPFAGWTDPNPGLELDYRRFMSEAYRDFQREQIHIIRRYSPGRRITHNITPMMFDVCLWELTEDLDFAGYDHYQMTATPDPVSTASQYNLMRSLKGGTKFAVLEQQPVQVNWQSVNGRWGIDWLFLWGMQAALLGAESMYYFSWQRFYGGSEQYHDGVVPHDLRVPRSRQEKVIAAKLESFADLQKHLELEELPVPAAEVLLINSMTSLWAHEISSQTVLWQGIKLIEELQEPFLQNGIGVDMAPSVAAAKATLNRYKLLILPGYAFAFSKEEAAQISAFIAQGGMVWSLPRTAVKDQANRMVPFPLNVFDQDDFYFDDGGGLLADEREQVELDAAVLGASCSAQGTPFPQVLSGKIWADKLVLVNHQRWQVAATFGPGQYAGSPAVLVTKRPKGHGLYAHFAFWPERGVALNQLVINLFGLTPHLSAPAGDRPLQEAVQTYSFVQGARRFVAAINFGTTSTVLVLPSLEGKAQRLRRGYRAKLAFDLKLEGRVDQPQDPHSCHLEGREFGVWELV